MNENSPIQEGPPWEKVGKYDTFEEANVKRNSILGEEDLQVKVHRMGPEGCHFVVKSRIDPTHIDLTLRREEKKRRKKRLQKKRRKK